MKRPAAEVSEAVVAAGAVGLRELDEVQGAPDADDAPVLDVQPTGRRQRRVPRPCGGVALPRMSSVLPPPGQLALAPDVEARSAPLSLTYGGERGYRHRLAPFSTGLHEPSALQQVHFAGTPENEEHSRLEMGVWAERSYSESSR
jgi:hypothetical protein